MEGITATDPFGQVVTYLLSFGLPGVVIIALGFAYWRKDKRVEDLQDTLIEMSKEYAKAMAESTAALNAMRDLLISRRSRG